MSVTGIKEVREEECSIGGKTEVRRNDGTKRRRGMRQEI